MRDLQSFRQTDLDHEDRLGSGSFQKHVNFKSCNRQQLLVLVAIFPFLQASNALTFSSCEPGYCDARGEYGCDRKAAWLSGCVVEG